MLLKVKNKIIYSPGICRTGTTSLMDTLDKYTIPLHAPGDISWVKKTDLSIKNKHLPYEIMNLKRLSSEVYKFAIVRNPWSKMYSQYKRDASGSTDSSNYEINRDKFNEYINNLPHVIDKDSGGNQYRWFSQIRWLGGTTTRKHGTMDELLDSITKEYDYIDKFENIAIVKNKILNDIGLDPKEYNMPHLNKSSNNPKDYLEFYDQSSIDLISNIYKEDIKYLNYTYEN